MSRKPITTIANKPEEFICDEHKELDRAAEALKDRPIIFFGKRLNRDQQYAVMDLISLKDTSDPSKGIIGTGPGYKYMWNNLITEVHNVFEPGDIVEGTEKDALWDADGIVAEISEAITHFYLKSAPQEEDLKTSD